MAVPKSSLIPIPDALPGNIAVLAEPLAYAINALERINITAAIPDWSPNALKQRSKEFTFRKLFLKFSLKSMASAIFLQ